MKFKFFIYNKIYKKIFIYIFNIKKDFKFNIVIIIIIIVFDYSKYHSHSYRLYVNQR